MRGIFFILSFILYANLACSQDLISGRWQGNFKSNISLAGTEKLIVILEVYNDSMIKGTSHLFYSRNRFEHYVVRGKYNKNSGVVYFKEVREIEVDLGPLGSNILGNYTMQLTKTDSSLRLEGRWKENGTSFSLSNSKVWLERMLHKDDTLKPEKTIIRTIDKEEQPIKVAEAKTPDPVNLAAMEKEKLAREIEVQQAIAIPYEETDSIKIEVWDNARIDGDIISLFVNDSMVIDREKITEIPITRHITIPTDKEETYIRLVADSYGSMPPCTAHMTISTKTMKREFELLSNYDLNAAVKLMVIKNR